MSEYRFILADEALTASSAKNQALSRAILEDICQMSIYIVLRLLATTLLKFSIRGSFPLQSGGFEQTKGS